MVKIRMTRLVISPTYGNCGPGDVVRCSEAFARHCIEDLDSAEWVVRPAVKKVAKKRGARRVSRKAS